MIQNLDINQFDDPQKRLKAMNLHIIWVHVDGLIREFEAAVALKEHGGSFSSLAGKAGALIIKEVFDLTQASNSLIGQLWGRANTTVQSPDKYLEAHFNELTKVRDASVHTASTVANAKKIDEHFLTEDSVNDVLTVGPDVQGQYMYMGFSGDYYCLTWNQKLVKYPLNQTSLNHLLHAQKLMTDRVPS